MDSRRTFLRGLGAGGAGMLVGACGGGSERTTTARADAEADAAVLNSALDLEAVAIAAYRAGAGRLTGELAATGRRFLEHEREHAEALRVAIRDLGARPNRARDARVPRLRDGRAVLRYAVEIERTAVAAYLDLLPRLTEPELRSRAASILTTQAEHIVVLESALGGTPPGSAFVTGTPA